MGGYGSTRWGWYTRKTTVEECHTLSVFKLIGDLIPRHIFEERRSAAGSLHWTNKHTGEETASVGFRLEYPDPSDDRVQLWLNYTVITRSGEEQREKYSIWMSPTYPHYGGVRWWFQCPLVINNRPCQRRVGKLYLPPGRKYFGCRHCYELTYTSAQEAHKWDGLYAMLAVAMQDEYPGITGREVGRVLNERF